MSIKSCLQLPNRFKVLAQSVYGYFLRQIIKVNQPLPKGTVIKIADTFDELYAAYQIAQQAYLDMGLINNPESEYRTTKYHLLPTTSVVILKINDEVVATLSVIIDSSLGLPIEELFDISQIRKNSTRIAEVSTLAIKKGYRKSKGLFLLPLIKFTLELGHKILGVDKYVIATHPRAYNYYHHLLGFQALNNGEIKKYKFVNGALALGQYLDVKNSPKNLKKMYRFRSPQSNFGDYVYNFKSREFKLPTELLKLVGKPILDPKQIEFFFALNNKIIKKLTKNERLAIGNLYSEPEYRKTLEFESKFTEKCRRKNFRYQVYLNGHLRSENEPKDDVTVLEASKTGLRLSFKSKNIIKFVNQIVKIDIKLNNKSSISLNADVAWLNKKTNQAALKLTNPSAKYNDLINDLEIMYKS